MIIFTESGTTPENSAFVYKLKRLPYAEYVSDCVVPGLIGKFSSPAVDHIMADFSIRLINAINLGNKKTCAFPS